MGRHEVGVGVVCSEFAARHLANKTHAMKTFFLRFVRFLSPVSVDAFASFLIQLKFKKPLIINRSKYPVNLKALTGNKWTGSTM